MIIDHSDNWNKETHELIGTVLPNNTIPINVSGQLPPDVIKDIDAKINRSDSLLIHTDAVWWDSENNFFIDYLTQYPNKQFYISTVGYENEWLADNILKFALPWTVYRNSISYDTKQPVKSRNLKYGYSLINNYPKYARLHLGYHLWKNNLIDKIIYSQGVYVSDDPYTPSFPDDYLAELLQELDNFDEYKDLLPISFISADINDTAKDHSIEHPAFNESYVNIVSETEIEDVRHDCIIPRRIQSEKTYKPLYSKSLPIYYAAPGQIEFLESYDIDCFKELLPNDWDTWGIYAKTKYIIELIQTFKPEDYYFENLDRIEENFRIVTSDHLKIKAYEKIRELL